LAAEIKFSVDSWLYPEAIVQPIELPPKGGSSAGLLLRGPRQEAKDEEVKYGTAEHLPFDEFEAVDLNFSLNIALLCSSAAQSAK
jgi:hypothetical protein